jgi:hypothetical protein
VRGNESEFEAIHRNDVPRTRTGKHHDIVEKIMREVEGLRGKKALKIPRGALGSAKIEHVRAALSRASARMQMELATSADEKYFYVWRQD